MTSLLINRLAALGAIGIMALGAAACAYDDYGSYGGYGRYGGYNRGAGYDRGHDRRVEPRNHGRPRYDRRRH